MGEERTVEVHVVFKNVPMSEIDSFVTKFQKEPEEQPSTTVASSSSPREFFLASLATHGRVSYSEAKDFGFNYGTAYAAAMKLLNDYEDELEPTSENGPKGIKLTDPAGEQSATLMEELLEAAENSNLGNPAREFLRR